MSREAHVHAGGVEPPLTAAEGVAQLHVDAKADGEFVLCAAFAVASGEAAGQAAGWAGELGDQRLGVRLLGDRHALGEEDVYFRRCDMAQEEIVDLWLHVKLQLTGVPGRSAQCEVEGRVAPWRRWDSHCCGGRLSGPARA